MRILRGLGSRLLACGCFVGVYETYGGETVEIVEERGPRCTDPSHEEGRATREPARSRRRSEQHVA
jgi:hypothetical protein